MKKVGDIQDYTEHGNTIQNLLGDAPAARI